jgi:uncharacterized membrane protein YqhA
LEEFFEAGLFNCRFLVVFAVLGSLVAAVVLFLKGSLEIIQGVNGFFKIITHFGPTSSDDKSVILAFIPAIDNYLFATVLLIFSMGIYELFVSEIDPALRLPTSRPNWLNIENLDDLRTHISEVVIVILIINFFELSFTVPLTRPLDLLLLGSGIFLVAAALFITHRIIAHRARRPNRRHHSKPTDSDVANDVRKDADSSQGGG